MTSRQIDQNDLDRLMRQWMDDDALMAEPADLIDRVLVRTRRSRQMPSWLAFDRWIQMQLTLRRTAVPRLAPLLLVLGLIIAMGLATIAYLGSRAKIPPPFGEAGNGRIAYLSGGQIYSAESDGSQALQLTADESGAATPVFSHDGTRVAYKRLTADEPTDDPTLHGDLIVVNADGSNPIVIETRMTGMSPTAWSPDDQELLYSGTTSGGPEQIFIASADGSSPPLRVGNQRGENWAPTWSPDAQRIAYVENTTIHVMNRDGTGDRAVSTGHYRDQSGATWNSDGTALVFSAGSPGRHDLWVVGLDGAPERPLAATPAHEDSATFSPDGEWLAYARIAPGGRSMNVVLVRDDGSEERALPGSYGLHGPLWSPDGSLLLVGGLDGGVYALDPFGDGAPRQINLPQSELDARYDMTEIPAWQRRAQ
jgi:Tol biopolymer transport system component